MKLLLLLSLCAATSASTNGVRVGDSRVGALCTEMLCLTMMVASLTLLVVAVQYSVCACIASAGESLHPLYILSYDSLIPEAEFAVSLWLLRLSHCTVCSPS